MSWGRIRQDIRRKIERLPHEVFCSMLPEDLDIEALLNPARHALESTSDSLCRRDDISSSSSEVATLRPLEREKSTVGCEGWAVTSMG